MKKIKLFLLTALLLMPVRIFAQIITTEECLKNDHIECLSNLKLAKAISGKRLDVMVNNYGRQFTKCDNLKLNSEYLKAIKWIDGGPAEIFFQNLANVFTANPDCFFNSVKMTDKITANMAICYLYGEHEAETDMENAPELVKKYSQMPKYKMLFANRKCQ